MSSINVDCEHQWDSGAPVRLCLRCGQIRGFPQGESRPRIVWPGCGCEDDPLLLPKADKAIIAIVAKRYGLKRAAGLTGITWTTLRPWVSVYCRESEPQVVVKAETPMPTEPEPSTPSPEPPELPKTLQPEYQPKGSTPLGRPTSGEVRKCAICGREFYAKRYLIERGRGLYCRDCKVKVPTLRAGHCPDCKGDLKKDVAGEKLLCQQCAKEWPILPEQKEPKWERKSIESHDQDKEKMIRDYFEMRLLDFLRKWHISSQIWLKLKRRWGVPRKGYYPQRAHQGRTSKSGPKLPEFPPFNDSWAPEVQAEWFRTYRALKMGG